MLSWKFASFDNHIHVNFNHNFRKWHCILDLEGYRVLYIKNNHNVQNWWSSFCSGVPDIYIHKSIKLITYSHQCHPRLPPTTGCDSWTPSINSFINTLKYYEAMSCYSPPNIVQFSSIQHVFSVAFGESSFHSGLHNDGSWECEKR